MLTLVLYAIAAAVTAARLRHRPDDEKSFDQLVGVARLALGLHVAFFAVFGAGEVIADPGGLVAVGAVAGAVLVAAGVRFLTLRLPDAAVALFVVLLGLAVAGMTVSSLADLWDRIGPVPLVLAVVVQGGAVVLARRRQLAAGWLSLAVGAALLVVFAPMTNGPLWMAVNGLALIAGAPVLSGVLLLVAGRRQRTSAQPDGGRIASPA
jgi:hypothetical protein